MSLQNLMRVLPVFIVAMKAVNNAALSLYAIQAYDFGGAVASPVERNTDVAAAAATSLTLDEWHIKHAQDRSFRRSQMEERREGEDK